MSVHVRLLFVLAFRRNAKLKSDEIYFVYVVKFWSVIKDHVVSVPRGYFPNLDGLGRSWGFRDFTQSLNNNVKWNFCSDTAQQYPRLALVQEQPKVFLFLFFWTHYYATVISDVCASMSCPRFVAERAALELIFPPTITFFQSINVLVPFVHKSFRCENPVVKLDATQL